MDVSHWEAWVRLRNASSPSLAKISQSHTVAKGCKQTKKSPFRFFKVPRGFRSRAFTATDSGTGTRSALITLVLSPQTPRPRPAIIKTLIETRLLTSRQIKWQLFLVSIWLIGEKWQIATHLGRPTLQRALFHGSPFCTLQNTDNHPKD